MGSVRSMTAGMGRRSHLDAHASALKTALFRARLEDSEHPIVQAMYVRRSERTGDATIFKQRRGRGRLARFAGLAWAEGRRRCRAIPGDSWGQGRDHAHDAVHRCSFRRSGRAAGADAGAPADEGAEGLGGRPAVARRPRPLSGSRLPSRSTEAMWWAQSRLPVICPGKRRASSRWQTLLLSACTLWPGSVSRTAATPAS
jgi:hypothetical protein